MSETAPYLTEDNEQTQGNVVIDNTDSTDLAVAYNAALLESNQS